MLRKDDLILVAGAGGFIGGHLVGYLRHRGHTQIRAVDVKPLDQWYQVLDDVQNIEADLQDRAECLAACQHAREVYNLAADMGGMGFIENNKAKCMLSVLINTHLLMAAHDARVERYFYASSACVYNADRQKCEDVVPLCEADAYPAMPEDGYGWEKLFSERMCRHFREDFALTTRVARFHNVYGPHGTWDGGREKAPAAICRKVIHAVETGNHEIEIWGTGRQTRSFMYIDDCLYGIDRIMHSEIEEPINLGSSEIVTINGLVDIVEAIAGVKLERRYNLDAPKGVNGRNSDNTKIQEYLGWEPSIPLRDGMRKTYEWIHEEYRKRSMEHGAEGMEHGAEGMEHGAEGMEHGARSMEQEAGSMEHGAEGKEHGARSMEQEAGSMEQGAEGKEQGAEGKEQGAEGKEQGARSMEQEAARG